MTRVNLIGQAEYAKMRGVSTAAVSKAVAEGRTTLRDGKIDPVAADARWARNSRVRNGSGQAGAAGSSEPELPLGDAEDGERGEREAASAAPAPAPRVSSDEYSLARAKRETADAELAATNLAERRGELIQVRAVEVAWTQAMTVMREHLLQVRARLAPVLAAETDAFKVGQLLEQEHCAALDLMCRAGYSQAGVRGEHFGSFKDFVHGTEPCTRVNGQLLDSVRLACRTSRCEG